MHSPDSATVGRVEDADAVPWRVVDVGYALAVAATPARPDQ
jgi:hypothetical protein